jgi:hypothetical protein
MKNSVVSKIESYLSTGNIASLSPDERVSLLAQVTESMGLNPLTRPVQILSMNGSTVLYVTKGACDQLRAIHNISIRIIEKEVASNSVTVVVSGTTPEGRTDEEVAVCFGNPAKDPNLVMKTLSKAKRRLTLSIVGLGMLSEDETETVPGARRFEVSEVAQDSPAPRSQSRVVEALRERLHVQKAAPSPAPAPPAASVKGVEFSYEPLPEVPGGE